MDRINSKATALEIFNGIHQKALADHMEITAQITALKEAGKSIPVKLSKAAKAEETRYVWSRYIVENSERICGYAAQLQLSVGAVVEVAQNAYSIHKFAVLLDSLSRKATVSFDSENSLAEALRLFAETGFDAALPHSQYGVKMRRIRSAWNDDGTPTYHQTDTQFTQTCKMLEKLGVCERVKQDGAKASVFTDAALARRIIAVYADAA